MPNGFSRLQRLIISKKRQRNESRVATFLKCEDQITEKSQNTIHGSIHYHNLPMNLFFEDVRRTVTKNESYPSVKGRSRVSLINY